MIGERGDCHQRHLPKSKNYNIYHNFTYRLYGFPGSLETDLFENTQHSANVSSDSSFMKVLTVRTTKKRLRYTAKKSRLKPYIQAF